jgi:PAS domain S-box-containing protein
MVLMTEKDASTLTIAPAPHYGLIWLGVLAGVGFYFLDAFVDSVLFNEGALRDQLLHPSASELWMRTCVLVLAVAFASYAQLLLRREHETSERAKIAEIFLNSIVDNIPNMVFIKDAGELRFIRVNKTAERLLGLSNQELMGKSDYDFFPEPQAKFFTQKDREVLKTGIGINIPEEEIDTEALGKRWLHTRKVPILDDKGQPIYLLGVSEDITESRQAEIDWKKTEIRFQTLFNSAADSVFVIDPEGKILQTNRYACDHSGYEEHEIVGSNIKKFFTRESQDTCDCNFPGLREQGYNRADIEFICKDGHVIHMECVATGVPDEDGCFTSFLIIQRDVTERLQAARKLEESERRFRAIYNSTFQFIGLLDPEGTILEANQTALDFIGCSNADIVGKPFWETPWWTHSPQLQKRLKEGIIEARHGKLVRFEGKHLGRDGQRIVIDFSLKPVMNEQGEVVLIIPEGRDISERVLAEEEAQRMHQESAHVMRLSTMGEMASGMAHELNQPLTALISYCGTALKLARDVPSLPEGYIDILERASAQAHRAGDVIWHLREFVSKGNNNKTRVVLDELIHGVIDFIGWDLRDSDIQVAFQPDTRAHEVCVDKIQIEQVLINLVRNGIEAIKGADISGGQVDIATRLTADGSTEVTVADNGPGIDSSMTDSLFEPYQTSKETGMGMGLSISRSIMEAHNGKLWTDKQRHKGALFYMRIPGCE